ncbi:hypothetical protein ACIBG7_15130 [Nonomuraea sp. NPDC050328]|uniref:hypothetical protein n=1 Tax=Nonomuraea sp. NPDC050328 TaxID=3364361 RepID=UPI0037ADAAEB
MADYTLAVDAACMICGEQVLRTEQMPGANIDLPDHTCLEPQARAAQAEAAIARVRAFAERTKIWGLPYRVSPRDMPGHCAELLLAALDASEANRG